MKSRLINILPSFLASLVKRFLASEWAGDFSSWEEAAKKATGYNSNNILDNVTQSLLKVKNGEAVYERDSVLFNDIQYSWPLLSGLMWIAATKGGKLEVIDFGGSLGSSYFQNRLFLDSLSKVSWNIVEQEQFVERGKKLFQNGKLKFYRSIDESYEAGVQPSVIILSCVLPYIEEPYSLIKKILSYQFPYIIIDNTPFNFEKRDRICVQNVPESIYKASIPCWLLNYDHLKTCLNDQYNIIAEYQNGSFVYIRNKRVQYKGLIAKLNLQRHEDY